MIVFKSVTTKKLSKKTIKDICKIKNKYWSHGLKSQLKYFKKNIKDYDTHNLIYKNNDLAGYTAFRLRRIFLGKRVKKYLLLDTIIVKKKYREKNLGKILMEYNNQFIKDKKLISILFCTKNRSKFFRKYLWQELKRKNYSLLDHNFSEKTMFFNKSRLKFRKYDLLKISVKK